MVNFDANFIKDIEVVADSIRNNKKTGHLYIQIKDNLLKTTENKKLSNSMKDVVKFVSNFNKYESISLQELDILKHSFDTISRGYLVKHKSFFAKLNRFFSKSQKEEYRETKAMIEEAKKSLQNFYSQIEKNLYLPIEKEQTKPSEKDELSELIDDLLSALPPEETNKEQGTVSEALETLKNQLSFTDSLLTTLNSLIDNNEIEPIKHMAQTYPEEFKSILKIQDEQGFTPLANAAYNNQMEIVKYIAEVAPEEFKAALKIGYVTPLLIAVNNNNMEMIKYIAKVAPKEFKEAVKIQNQGGTTPVKLAADNNAVEIVKYMHETAPEEFKTALKMQDQEGWTPLRSAVNKLDMEMFEYIVKAAPEDLKSTLNMQDQGGLTLLGLAATNYNIEMIKYMAKAAPEQFKAALKIQDKDGDTPLILAIRSTDLDVETLKLLGIEDREVVNILDKEGRSALFMIKQIRPKHYHEIAQLFKTNIPLRQLRKGQVQRIALAHAWHIPGKTTLIKADSGETLSTIQLEGHRAAEWFHLMDKNFNQLKELYPNLLSSDQMTLLKHLLKLGANDKMYSIEDKLKAIQAGVPTMIHTGYQGHAVSLLIWGNQLIICNRGGASRNPIEVFHFDPTKIDLQTLKEIVESVDIKSKEDYQKYFFTELRKKLGLYQNELDLKMQAECALPDQTVGNCSFVSGITLIYAFILLGNVRGMSAKGQLADEVTHPFFSKRRAEASINAYQTLLSNLQINILETNIRPLEKGDFVFEPDYHLLKEALRKACLLPLDALCQSKLNALIDIYLQSLEKNEKTQMKSDIMYWKSLARQPLL